MNIYRYTSDIQKLLGCKTKPEPWLHIAILATGQTRGWVIYVWDTRKVIEEGGDKAFKDFGDFGATPQYKQFMTKFMSLKPQSVRDNHEPLVGGKQIASKFNANVDFAKHYH